MSFSGEHIWVIGASSGIGEALARLLADQGATLILSARRTEELEQLRQDLGDHHHAYPLDVSDNQRVVETASAIVDAVGKIDRVIFMAAIYKPGDMDITPEFAKQMIDVNVMGALYVTYAMLPIFDQQQSGQLALCSSVAAYTGLPGGQPYCASKAAVMNFAESLAVETPDYVDVKLISPGFVRTRITAKNQFHMPFLIEPEQAAQAIAKGLKRRSFEIHFPKRFTLMVKFLRLLPYALALRITGGMRGKA